MQSSSLCSLDVCKRSSVHASSLIMCLYYLLILSSPCSCCNIGRQSISTLVLGSSQLPDRLLKSFMQAYSDVSYRVDIPSGVHCSVLMLLTCAVSSAES